MKKRKGETLRRTKARLAATAAERRRERRRAKIRPLINATNTAIDNFARAVFEHGSIHRLCDVHRALRLGQQTEAEDSRRRQEERVDEMRDRLVKAISALAVPGI